MNFITKNNIVAFFFILKTMKGSLGFVKKALLPFIMFFPLIIYSQNDFYSQIAEIRIQFNETQWDSILDSLFENYGEEGRLMGNVTINGKLFKNAGVRYKGFSSWAPNQNKNPFNIDLDFKTKNANYQGYTKLKLSNVISDPSFVREVLSYEIARKYMYASNAFFANVYVNDVLIGLYSNVEAVDTYFLERHFQAEDPILIKGNPEHLEYPFGQNANLAYTHGSDSTGYMPYYKLQTDYGWNQLFQLIYILNNDTAQLNTILDIDKTLWMHAFNYALVNLDSYIGYAQNYYLYYDENGKFNPILWDLNMSFGSFRNADAISLNLTVDKAKKLNPLQHLTGTALSPRPLMKQLFLNTTYRKMYMAHLRTIINENFVNDWYYQRASQLQSIIDSSVLNDTNKFYTYQGFHFNLDSETVFNSIKYPGIKDFVESRVDYLSTYQGFNGAPVILWVSNDSLLPVKGEEVWITTSVSDADKVKIMSRYTSQMPFQTQTMYDDGLHNDGQSGDGVFGAKLIAVDKILQYYIWAENDSAGIFSPERAAHEFYTVYQKINPGDVVINEIQLQSDSSAWVELYNNTAETLSLSQLVFNNQNTFYSLPDTLVPAHSFYYFNLSFLPGSGKCKLMYNNSLIIDEQGIIPSGESRSFGRYPNGTGAFSILVPTPKAYNQLPNMLKSDFYIYPNPVKNNLFVELNNFQPSFTFEIINCKGESMSQSQITEMENSGLYNIDVSHLQSGIYLILVRSSEQAIHQKFIIQ